MKDDNILNDTLSRSIIAKDIIAAIKKDIVTKKISPGTKLTENVLIKKYSVSRVPVRSALRALADEGFLESKKNGVHYVPYLSVKFFEDIYEVRDLLERKAVEIILKSDFTDYSPLLQSLSAMKEQAHLHERTNEINMDLAALSMDIHYQIMALSGNRALLRAWSTTSKFNVIFMTLNIHNYSLENMFNDHNRLCSAIIQKHPDCLEILKEHIEISKDMFIGEFREMYGTDE